MANVFSWRDHPEVTKFVADHFCRTSSPELATAIHERFGVWLSPGAIRRQYCRIKEQSQEVLGVTDPLDYGADEAIPQPAVDERFPDRKPPQSDAEVLEMYELATRQIRLKESTFTGQTDLTINFSSVKKPIGICFWGDWQVGSYGVLMEQLLKDAETIANTDGLYVFVMGDLIQNLNQKKHPSSLHDCVLPDPRDQESIAMYLLRKTRHKILGLVTGNHEENSKVAAGLTLTERFAKDISVPFLWHGAKNNVTVGKELYKIGVRHKYKNESSVSTTNSQRNMHCNVWPDCDVICVGDKHFNDLQKTPRPLGDTIYLRCGSYQRTDEFGMMVGQYRGSWGLPIVICYPQEKQTIPIFGKDFYTGISILQSERERFSSSASSQTR